MDQELKFIESPKYVWRIHFGDSPWRATLWDTPNWWRRLLWRLLGVKFDRVPMEERN